MAGRSCSEEYDDDEELLWVSKLHTALSALMAMWNMVPQLSQIVLALYVI